MASDGFISNAEKLNASAIWTLTQVKATTVAYTAPLDNTGSAVVCDATQNYVQSTLANATALATDGPWTVCVKLSDVSNNIVYGKAETIIRKVAGPTFTSMLGANAASDAVVSNPEKLSVLPAWSLSASDYSAVSYSLPASDTGGSLACTMAILYGQTTIPVISTLGTDGLWSVCVELTDSIGNVTYGKAQQLNRDTAVPTVTFTALTTADQRPPLAGTVSSPSVTVSLNVDGVDYSATNLGNGNWSIADNVITTLPHNYYSITVSATDAIGNVGTQTTPDALKIISNEFISTWKTDNAGTSGPNSISLPLVASGSYNFVVDWGDTPASTSTITAWNDAAVTHTYATPGIKTITITGLITGWKFERGRDSLKMLSISAWGPFKFGNDERYFDGAENLTITATDRPNLSGTTRFYAAFNNCYSLTSIPNMDKWDVSAATSMEAMFQNAHVFNQNLNSWVPSLVTDFRSMFQGARLFNGAIGSWNVSSALTMRGMFQDARVFNQSLRNWSVANVTDMDSLFQDAYIFDGDITIWDVRSVTNFNRVFNNAREFNQNIGGWNVSAATSMTSMFQGALKFNQNIGSWTVNSVTSMKDMFRSATLFNQDLGWTVTNVTNFESMFQSAIAFNGNIEGWRPGSALSMTAMFFDAIAFDRDISLWTVGNVQKMDQMFEGATIFNKNIGNWDVHSVQNFRRMFVNTRDFNQTLTWTVTAATDMSEMFSNAAGFNSPLVNWNVASVTNMSKMFVNAKIFNQNLNWSVGNVTNFEDTFRGAWAFNGDISSWRPTAALTMSGMFYDARAFNSDISTWHNSVGSVTTMERMFQLALVFNQPIGNWNVGSVANMRSMFHNATAFDQNLGAWDMESVTDATSMLAAKGLSVANYDALLLGWSSQTLKTGVSFDAGYSRYSTITGAPAKTSIETNFGWTIADQGVVP